MESKVFVRKSQNAAPDNFYPYNALTINIILLFELNSAPTLVRPLSRGREVRYALCIQYPITFRLFKAGILKAILSESQDTTY